MRRRVWGAAIAVVVILNDFGLQIADPYITYVTAIAAVPVGATGAPESLRAWVRPTCGAHPAFAELTHA